LKSSVLINLSIVSRCLLTASSVRRRQNAKRQKTQPYV